MRRHEEPHGFGDVHRRLGVGNVARRGTVVVLTRVIGHVTSPFAVSWRYGDDAANVLYHVVNDRHIRRRSMIFTTNKHPTRWGDVLHDDDLAAAIVDRILERGRLLRLDGPSLRTKHLPEDELRMDDQDQSGDRRVSGKSAAEFPERTESSKGLSAVSIVVGTASVA